MAIISPVRGLRPVRADRLLTENVPKPESVTESPSRKVPAMISSTASTARVAEALFSSVLTATLSIRSVLFTLGPLAGCGEQDSRKQLLLKQKRRSMKNHRRVAGYIQSREILVKKNSHTTRTAGHRVVYAETKGVEPS